MQWCLRTSPANVTSCYTTLTLEKHRTGYVRMREANAEILGSDVMDQVDQVYGLDDEGELNGSYRPSGYPGVC